MPSRFQIKIFSNYVKHIAEKTICRIFTLDYEKDSSNGSKYFTRIFIVLSALTFMVVFCHLLIQLN